MILAPLRGVTIRSFRETFAEQIAEAGFTEAVTPFIPAMAGLDPLKDRELVRVKSPSPRTLLVTPQFIGKDPQALRACLEKVKAAGFETADLNCGCPFPMVRNKGRGSGILRTPEVLRQMLEVGCSVMGPGQFSIKARLGIDRNDELLKLLPLINVFPLRYLTVHARNAKQMYDGVCDTTAFEAVKAAAKVPIVYNGDVPCLGIDAGKLRGDGALAVAEDTEIANPPATARAPSPRNKALVSSPSSVMVGRGFVRYIGTREDAGELLLRYIAASQAELCGDRPVLGRMKELLAYWKDLPQWKRRWDVLKVCRSVDELRAAIW